MAWENLSEDVLGEFCEKAATPWEGGGAFFRALEISSEGFGTAGAFMYRGSANLGFSFRSSAEEVVEQSRQWRKDNAHITQSAAFRKRAVENTKKWRIEQRTNPEKREAYYAKQKARDARYRAQQKSRPESIERAKAAKAAMEVKKLATAKRRENMKLNDPRAYARMMAKQNSRRRSERNQRRHADGTFHQRVKRNRTSRIVAAMTGLITADTVTLQLNLPRDAVHALLSRMRRWGQLERVDASNELGARIRGVYRSTRLAVAEEFGPGRSGGSAETPSGLQ